MMLRAAALACLVMLLAACGTGVIYPPGPATSLDAGQVQNIQVFANGDWQDSGVQVQRGQTYKITATGQWSNGAWCGTTDASGKGVTPMCGGDPWGIGAMGSAMIGRVGIDGKPFPVGSSLTFTATADGNLFLRDYDIIEFDNVGAMNVTIVRDLPAKAPAAAPARIDVAAAPTAQAAPKASPRSAPIRFPQRPERPDDVAVIIGNGDYAARGARDIPDVRPAHADADEARTYATRTLGIRDGNVIFMKDATGAQMTRVFGSDKDPRGQLFDWVKPGKSRVFVYYSGHGAPGGGSGGPYLVPADADAARIELSGYPLKQLYDNLGKLPADSVTIVLEACFSGLSPAGSVLGKASPVFFEVKAPPVPAGLTVIAAGAADQVASWEPDDSHGLFTRHFLEGMAGLADFDKDGKVSLDELDRHLKATLTYQARRHYGRDQNAQIVTGGGR